MDGYSINGLPLHILLVHAVVVLIPLTAVGLVLSAVWPAARRRLGFITALIGLVLIGLVPLTTQAGQWLKERVAGTPLVENHASLGDRLWPWSLALGLLAVASWLWHFFTARRDHRRTSHRGARRTVAVVIAILAFGVGGMAVYQTILVGESGTRAVWENSFRDTRLD